MKKAYCGTCKSMVEMNNPELKKTKKGFILKGSCKNCGRNISSIISKADAQKIQEKSQTQENYYQPLNSVPEHIPEFTEPEPQTPKLETQLPAPKEFQDYANEKPYMKENGLKVVNNNYYNLIKFGLIGLGIFCALLIYLIYNGYTTDEINIPSCPNISIPECPDCSTTCGDCAPTTNCNFPQNLSINLVNGT